MMEAVGLVYNPSMQVIICIEHGYCLAQGQVSPASNPCNERRSSKGSMQ